MKCAKKNCRAHALKNGDGFCFFHSALPEIAAKRKRARQRGGNRRKFQRKNDAIDSIEDVKAILEETINELRCSATDNIVSKARALGYLCSEMRTTLEKSDLEERIARLEKIMTT